MKTRYILILGLICALSLGAYVTVSHLTYGVGFPLDDAWIYQTYARNLVMYGEWVFNSGIRSAGSTGPLYVFLVAIGYLFSIDTIIWTYFLGWASLWGLSIMAIFAFQQLQPKRDIFSIAVGVLFAFEWHLVWAAGSGMETLFFALICTLVLVILATSNAEKKFSFEYKYWLILGTFIGISVWIRPIGVTLLGPAVFVILFNICPRRGKVKQGLFLIMGFSLVFGVYLYFNHNISGVVLPNTFYAKQAEYAIFRQQSFLNRSMSLIVLPLIGIGALLLPGFIWYGFKSIRDRLWGVFAGVLWVLGYIIIYAWRLPLTYQHGRYLIPIMPVFFLWGALGMLSWIRPRSNEMKTRVISRSWIVSTILILIIFWGVGANAYAKDVAVIESEMVVTARWVSSHTPQYSLVAAHDIGALGYFGNRRLLDLAGLISPEVIPFIRDESRLENYLDNKGANYLVAFPGWYPRLVNEAKLIYQTDGKYSPAMGSENMAVYAWSLR